MRRLLCIVACVTYALTLISGLKAEDTPHPAEMPNAPEATEAPEAQPPIFMETLRTGVEKQPELTMVLRLPDRSGEPPAGLLAFCTWQNETESLKKAVLNDKNAHIAWALRHRYAILTWNTARVWKSGKSHDDLDRYTGRLLEGEFHQVAKYWDYGLQRFRRQHGVPTENIFLYGFSGGAHWAHRLALHKPQRFLAVHIHVANSYDRPNRRASRLLWLVTTGDQDYGARASLKFYRQCEAMGYPILLKMERALGHTNSRATDKLRTAFFDYALDLQAQAEAGANAESAGEMMRAELEKTAWTGDLMNEAVFPAQRRAEIPEAQRIRIPEALTGSWGRVWKE